MNCRQAAACRRPGVCVRRRHFRVYAPDDGACEGQGRRESGLYRRRIIGVGTSERIVRGCTPYSSASNCARFATCTLQQLLCIASRRSSRKCRTVQSSIACKQGFRDVSVRPASPRMRAVTHADVYGSDYAVPRLRFDTWAALGDTAHPAEACGLGYVVGHRFLEVRVWPVCSDFIK